METDYPRSQLRLSLLFVGILIGFLAAISIWFFIRATTPLHKEPQTQERQTLSLNISSPNENLATSERILTISGTTGIASVVTITSTAGSKIIQGDNPTFSTTVELVEGRNVIDIVAYDTKTGTSQHEVREVLYLNEDLSSL